MCQVVGILLFWYWAVVFFFGDGLVAEIFGNHRGKLIYMELKSILSIYYFITFFTSYEVLVVYFVLELKF